MTANNAHSCTVDRPLLVFNAKLASVFDSEGGKKDLGLVRLKRYYLQAVARELLPGHRIIECLRSVIPSKGCVNIQYSKKFERAHYGNLVQCANVWVDPVCSSKITERRRIEITDALNNCEWPAVMITFTEQHDRDDRLIDLRQDMGKGLKALKSGWWWQEFCKRWGVIGSISANEVTFGLEFGSHPHVHGIYLVESIPDVEAIREDVSKKFEAIMAKSGRYVSPEVGVHVRATTDKAGDYISKWGAAYEVSKSPVKKGRGDRYNAFELLDLYAEGNQWAGQQFKEYAQAMRGVSQIRWSRGLRKLLSLGKEVTDQELVEAPMEEDVLLASLNLKQWSIILKQERRGELLEVASRGERGELRIYLKAIGIFLIDD